MALDKIKRHITKRAIREQWTPDQIQYAEDYIDAIAKDKATARRPVALKATYARIIRDLFRSRGRSRKLRDSS